MHDTHVHYTYTYVTYFRDTYSVTRTCVGVTLSLKHPLSFYILKMPTKPGSCSSGLVVRSPTTERADRARRHGHRTWLRGRPQEVQDLFPLCPTPWAPVVQISDRASRAARRARLRADHPVPVSDPDRPIWPIGQPRPPSLLRWLRLQTLLGPG